MRGHLPSRPRRRRLSSGSGGGPGDAAPADHRPRDRAPAHPERGRHGVGRLQRRDLQLPGAPPRARGAWACLLHRDGHGDDRPPLRGGPGRLREEAARHVRLRPLGCAPPDAAGGSRPAGHQAALLCRGRRQAPLRVGAEGAAAVGRRRGRPQLERGQPPLHVRVHARGGQHHRRRPQARARAHSARLAGPGRAHRTVLGSTLRARVRTARGVLRGAAPRAHRGIRPPAPRERRAAGRVPERRHRFELGRGDHGAAGSWPGEDVFDRLR